MASTLRKADLLNQFHRLLKKPVLEIVSERCTHQEKAQKVNALVNAAKAALSPVLNEIPINKRSDSALVLQYCYTVVSLEYRHMVWPYEYMAFSRRIGELWEAFCSAAWDYPSKPDVARITAPEFNAVRAVLKDRLRENIGKHEKKDAVLKDIDTLFEIIGDINMREDEVFTVKGIPYVVDFKSGFGSNEKGNMLRLQTVGRAYRIWNHQTKLLLLVRQEQNNNYLSVLRRAGLWSVLTGGAAYDQISEITGADMQQVRRDTISWSADLSPDFYRYLRSQPSDLTSYLAW